MKKLEDNDLRESFAKIHKKARDDLEKSSETTKGMTDQQKGGFVNYDRSLFHFCFLHKTTK